MKACTHTRREVRTEEDGCSFVQCQRCPARGPKRHSIRLAKHDARKSFKVR